MTIHLPGHFLLSLLTLLSGFTAAPDRTAAAPAVQTVADGTCILVEDFESYPVEGLPTRWKTNKGSRELKPMGPTMVDENEMFVIKQEAGNKFVRAIMRNQAHRLVFTNGDEFEWDLEKHPYLRWEWRAIELPEGAREDEEKRNDTGAAVYVTFSRDWLGRPVSIKYTYSSTLPIGTIVSYGPLKVIVVSSGTQNGTGKWLSITRNVWDDYKSLFGREPGNRPLALTLWSDSDSRKTISTADFDNLMLLADGDARACGKGLAGPGSSRLSTRGQ